MQANNFLLLKKLQNTENAQLCVQGTPTLSRYLILNEFLNLAASEMSSFLANVFFDKMSSFVTKVCLKKNNKLVLFTK